MDTATEDTEVPPDTEPDGDSGIRGPTTKMIVVVTGLVIPFEFAFAVTQYGSDPVAQTLAFSTVVILSVVHYNNSKRLAGLVQDHETIFRLVSNPLLRACYVCVGIAGAVSAGIVGTREPAAGGIAVVILLFAAALVYRMTRY